MPLPFMGGGVGLVTLPDAVSLSADWADSGGVNTTTTNDVTVVFKVNAGRQVSATKGSKAGAVLHQIEYRINSGSWTSYTAPITVQTGQTLAWRILRNGGGGADSFTFNVADVARGETIRTFNYTFA